MAEVDSSNPWECNDDDDDDNYPPQDSCSTIDSDSIASSRREQEMPLSLYWFIDERENNKMIKSIATPTHNNEIYGETKMLQNKIQSMEGKLQSVEGKLQSIEENFKNLISLLQNQQK